MMIAPINSSSQIIGAITCVLSSSIAFERRRASLAEEKRKTWSRVRSVPSSATSWRTGWRMSIGASPVTPCARDRCRTTRGASSRLPSGCRSRSSLVPACRQARVPEAQQMIAVEGAEDL